MKKLFPLLLLFALLIPAFAKTKEAGSLTSPRELHALATLSQQLQAPAYRYIVEEVLLEERGGKDVIVVYTYANAEKHPGVKKTIPAQIDRITVIQQKIPVLVYYLDKHGYMIFP